MDKRVNIFLGAMFFIALFVLSGDKVMSEKIRFMVVQEALRDKGFKSFMDAPLDLTLEEADEWAEKTMIMNKLINEAVKKFIEETK